jgi:2-pyrone-4,6-dicarboxylate lactonase
METSTAPACQGPQPVIEPPKFAVPAFACDTHAHVIGVPPAWELVPNRSYTPPEARIETYLAMLDAQHMARGVLVQPSVHGVDNGLMLKALERAPERLRGVAVVLPTISDSELDALHEAGVRGIRFNVLFGGGVGIENIDILARRIARLNWHVQLLIDARSLVELGPTVLRLPVDVVFDHMGHMPTNQMASHAGFEWQLRLLREQRAWVKLSGAYRFSVLGAPFTDAIEPARRLYDAAPDRCVWGSDWPHVAVPGPMFNTGELLDLFRQTFPVAEDRKRILADNPARLYGF